MPPGCEAAAFADDASDGDNSNNINDEDTMGGASQVPARGPPLSDPWRLLWPFPEPQPPIWLWWHLHQLSQ